jgi:hypothetical protein
MKAHAPIPSHPGHPFSRSIKLRLASYATTEGRSSTISINRSRRESQGQQVLIGSENREQRGRELEEAGPACHAAAGHGSRCALATSYGRGGETAHDRLHLPSTHPSP